MPADWADYLPPEKREARERSRQRLRLRALLKQRRSLLIAAASVYGVWTLGLLISGNGFVFVLALVPLLSLPAIAALAWWLLYKDFNG
jgi:predicted anti-sigma-YlaC factor YlaD